MASARDTAHKTDEMGESELKGRGRATLSESRHTAE